MPQIELNGRVFLSRAVIRDTITYLPVVPIAVALNTKIEWRASESTLKTAYGEVMGYEFKKQIYCNADDAVLLFNIDGGLQNTANGGKIFSLKSITPPTIEEPTPQVENPNDKPSTNKPTDKPTVPQTNNKPNEQPKPSTNPEPVEEPKTGVENPTGNEPVVEVDRPFEDQKSRTSRRNSSTRLNRV